MILKAYIFPSKIIGIDKSKNAKSDTRYIYFLSSMLSRLAEGSGMPDTEHQKVLIEKGDHMTMLVVDISNAERIEL